MRIVVFFCSLFFCSISFSQKKCKIADRKLKKVEKYIVNGDEDKGISLLLAIENVCEDAFFSCAVGDIYFSFKDINKAYYFYLKSYKTNNLQAFNNLSLVNFLKSTYSMGKYNVFHEIIHHDNFHLNINPDSDLNTLINKNNFALHQQKDSVSFNPIKLSINSVSDEYFPSMPINSNVLIYTYRNKELEFQDEDFYISRHKNGSWTKPLKLADHINSDYREGALSVSLDGKGVFFASCHRPDSYGGCDIYHSTLINDTLWSNSYNIGSIINTKYWESQPSISADGNSIFFTSNRDGGYGGSDIWMSKKHNNTWSSPINLGPLINTPSDESTPFLHYDNKTFYFSSKGHRGFGGFDLYVTKIDSTGKISQASNLGYPINTHHDESGLIVSRNGEKAYYNSNAEGDLNIYSFNLPNSSQANSVAIIKGVVLDSISRIGVQASIIINELNHIGEYSLTSDYEGAFSCVVPIESKFSITVMSNNYDFFSANYYLEKDQYSKDIYIVLNRLSLGNKISLDNIYYEFDRYALKEESLVQIKKFANYLLVNKNLRVEIEGHTDNIGSERYNNELSEKRAKSVYDALINFGVPQIQLSYQGYGYSSPLVDDDSDIARLKNRRTEVKVIGTYE